MIPILFNRDSGLIYSNSVGFWESRTSVRFYLVRKLEVKATAGTRAHRYCKKIKQLIGYQEAGVQLGFAHEGIYMLLGSQILLTVFASS